MAEDKEEIKEIKIKFSLKQAYALSRGIGRLARRKRFGAENITRTIWEQMEKKVKAVDLDQLQEEWKKTADIQDHDPEKQMKPLEHLFICGKCKNETRMKGKKAQGFKKRLRRQDRIATDDNAKTFKDKWGVEHKKPDLKRSFMDTDK